MGSKLFSKLRLRDLELENRIVVSPMCQYSAVDGVMNDWHLMHLGNLSVSGPGLVFVEATGVEPRGRLTPGCVDLHNDEQEASQKRVLEFCRNMGRRKWESNWPLPEETHPLCLHGREVNPFLRKMAPGRRWGLPLFRLQKAGMSL